MILITKNDLINLKFELTQFMHNLFILRLFKKKKKSASFNPTVISCDSINVWVSHTYVGLFTVHARNYMIKTLLTNKS